MIFFGVCVGVVLVLCGILFCGFYISDNINPNTKHCFMYTLCTISVIAGVIIVVLFTSIEDQTDLIKDNYVLVEVNGTSRYYEKDDVSIPTIKE